MAKLEVGQTPVRFVGKDISDAYFCLTDMCKDFEAESSFLIRSWMRNKSTLQFIEAWEMAQGDNFNHIEFDMIRNASGSNTFIVSVEQLRNCGCKSVYAKAGRYGGTFGHIAIAFHFANWLSAPFYYQFVTTFLQFGEHRVKRIWSKLNYQLHTDSIKRSLPHGGSRSQKGLIYASEADLLNLVVFGTTAAQ